MKSNVHVFSNTEFDDKESVLSHIGVRGQQYMEFAALKLPILPEFIIDSEVAASLDSVDLRSTLKKYMKKLEAATGKVFNDQGDPLLVKIVISPNLAIVHYPTLHNYGLTDTTIPGFTRFVGDEFGAHEVLFLIKGNLEIELKIAELEERTKDVATIQKHIDMLTEELEKNLTLAEYNKAIQKHKSLLDEGFFDDSYGQLEIALKRISRLLSLEVMEENDTALIVQPMVYGNYGKDSASGGFFTRNIVTGEKKLEGLFYQNKFNELGSSGKDISQIDRRFLSDLEKTARIVEDHFKEIRSIRFTIEKNKVWLIDQRPVMSKSTQADIKTLLDLNERKVIDEEHMIGAVKPGQLNEILHPIIDLGSVKDLPVIEGGISGAPGAAIGRVYFGTDRLLEAYKSFQQRGEDTRCILCMPATFAEDVKAIEVASGVLSSEGGYAAHASVVARQYGKVSLVKPDLDIRGNRGTIGKTVIKEGDVISLNVPHYGDPMIYLGKAGLIEPDPEESGLIEFIKIVKKHVGSFNVRANADTPRDAALALKFGAEGIGLCRTEHMFFDAKRINVFREMIVSETQGKRVKALAKLKKMQFNDFYGILKVMGGKTVTIRLLDAPLHEFLPHNDTEMKTFIEYLKQQDKNAKISVADIQASCEALREFNPMLGHRGCRIAVSYPEIYHMQIEAIFEAAYKLVSEGIDAKPEIMIPLIMNDAELKLIVYGKKIEGGAYKGIAEVEKDVRERLKVKPMSFKIGTMIELPVAALGAGEIARYAEFFSFGTNDLTQTTIGLSRDDYNSFMPDYTQFDIMDANPFMQLNIHVKELIETAVRRGRMTRPDLHTGLCGEHGAIPENIRFCKDVGLNYVSCSAYSVPIANLAIAQFTMEDNAKAE